MNIVIDVAFVIAITAFLKEQFGLKGYSVLIVAFMVALCFGFAPLLAGLFPAAGPYIKVFLDTVLLFLAAAGSYDFVASVKRMKAK